MDSSQAVLMWVAAGCCCGEPLMLGWDKQPKASPCNAGSNAAAAALSVRTS